MNSGDRLKKRREACNLTLRELSQITGISKATLSRYENNGIENIPMDKISTLAKCLDTTVEYLTGQPLSNKKTDNDLIYYLNSAANKKNSNFRHFFNNIDEFFYAVDEISRKQKEIDNITNKLTTVNKEGMLIINEFINYILSKEKYIDDKVESYVKMISAMEKDLKNKKK